MPQSQTGDVGGQKTLRSYWRNYFEKTDALIWVVDATDRLRIDDCREELHGLLQEEVCWLLEFWSHPAVLHEGKPANL
jgi:GTPase SAR1 family protein